MDMVFYSPSYQEDKESELIEVGISDTLWERIARSEFTKLGTSETTAINIDEEMIEISSVVITPILRKLYLVYFTELMFALISERVNEGDDIKREKYKSYRYDEISIIKIITVLNNHSFTLLQRG